MRVYALTIAICSRGERVVDARRARGVVDITWRCEAGVAENTREWRVSVATACFMSMLMIRAMRCRLIHKRSE